MIILGVHPGYHEAAACLFDDYRMVSAVSLERLTRRKIDGGRVPDEAIDECLTIAGLTRREVDAVVLGRGAFAWRYFKHFRGSRLLEGKVRHALGKEKHKSMERELVRAGHADSESLFNGIKFLADFGFRKSTRLCFFNHHLAHALPTLFHTDWEDALLYTSDGGGDNVQYSQRVFQDGELLTLFGGDDCFAAPARVDSLGLAYGYATQALGWRINRHEGKLTGLAALGRPSASAAIAAHFNVDADAQIRSDFATNPELRQFMFKTAENIPREDMAASIQEVLEQVTLESVRRLLKRYSVRRLGL
ncbi:MAG: carbamoyltransferase N-terminal domain-containing protein, partial [Alphaproteobacteria bacterium]